MNFRTALLQTLRAIQPVLLEEGVLVAGSEVPNLLEPDARSSLVVSRDVDVAVPVARHSAVKSRLREVKKLRQSPDEPTVWLPADRDLLEVNLIGMDAEQRPGETYVFEDDEMPLLVFGHLSLLRPGVRLMVEGLTIPLPRPAGLLIEKLVTDRSGEKGDRDLLVALALLLVSHAADLQELERLYAGLPADLRFAARSGLSTLSLLGPRAQMPDPAPQRARIAEVLARLEKVERTP